MLATGGAIRSTGEAIAPPVNMLDEALRKGGTPSPGSLPGYHPAQRPATRGGRPEMSGGGPTRYRVTVNGSVMELTRPLPDC